MIGDPIKCPCCKSENVKYEEVSQKMDESVYRIYFVYWLCQSCGVMFQRVEGK